MNIKTTTEVQTSQKLFGNERIGTRHEGTKHLSIRLALTAENGPIEFCSQKYNLSRNLRLALSASRGSQI